MNITLPYKILIALLIVSACLFCPETEGQEIITAGKSIGIMGMNLGPMALDRSLPVQKVILSVTSEVLYIQSPSPSFQDTARINQQKASSSLEKDFRQEEPIRSVNECQTVTDVPDRMPEPCYQMKGRYALLIDNMLRATLRVSSRSISLYSKGIIQ